MKRLTKHLKNALSAMAAAEAGEMLRRRDKYSHLRDRDDHASAAAADHRPVQARRRQVAVWLGDGAGNHALDYALTTCQRLDMDLAVLHPAALDVEPLLASRAEAIRAAGIGLESRAMIDASTKTLMRYLAHTPRIAFVVVGGNASELDALTDGLAHKGHRHHHPVPMVVVTAPVPEAANAPGVLAA